MFNYLQFICVLYIHTSLTENVKHKESTDAKNKDDVNDYGLTVLCKLQPNGYECQEHSLVSKYYYDIKLGDCRSAMFGQCKHSNLNAYTSLTECHTLCRDEGEHAITEKVSPRVFCRLQPDFGGCNSYHPMFYFDVTHRECRGFSYSGCGGNMNRFLSSQLCAATCMTVVQY